MEYDILQSDEKMRYMMLDRLKEDCLYYLGNGGRNERDLWAGNVEEQIELMRELYHSFPCDKKPEWLTLQEIDQFEQEMKNESTVIGAVFIYKRNDGHTDYLEVDDVDRASELYPELIVTGNLVNPNVRYELQGRPQFENFLGPMWDGDRLRYETQEIYDELTQ